MARRRARARRTNTAAAPDCAGPTTEVQRAAARLRRKAERTAKLVLIDGGEPTPEQLAKGRFDRKKIYDPADGTARIVRRNLATRNLERWYAAGKIDEREFRAGDKYRTDWERSNFEPRVTALYDIVSTGGGSGKNDGPVIQEDAWRAWRAARAELLGLAFGFDAMAVHDQLATEIAPGEDRIGIYTIRTSMMAVKLCLERLVIFYRL